MKYPTSDLKASVYTKKKKVTSGIFTVYHERSTAKLIYPMPLIELTQTSLFNALTANTISEKIFNRLATFLESTKFYLKN